MALATETRVYKSQDVLAQKREASAIAKYLLFYAKLVNITNESK